MYLTHSNFDVLRDLTLFDEIELFTSLCLFTLVSLPNDENRAWRTHPHKTAHTPMRYYLLYSKK